MTRAILNLTSISLIRPVSVGRLFPDLAVLLPHEATECHLMHELYYSSDQHHCGMVASLTLAEIVSGVDELKLGTRRSTPKHK